MKPLNLDSLIFLDSGDPEETAAILDLLGFLDGQTTNPTLVARNPRIQEQLAAGVKFTTAQLLDEYREMAVAVSRLIPAGSVSLEVYADPSTPIETMVEQARMLHSWIPNAHIKFPITHEGIEAARRALSEGMRVNMTLCFTQAQAAAVYAATSDAHRGAVYLSPFIGRVDDQGKNGMDLVSNIIRDYKDGDGHVMVLAASVRTVVHLRNAIAAGADIITAPLGVLRDWATAGFPLSAIDAKNEDEPLAPIPYKHTDLTKSWESYDLRHPLTDKGIERFAADWNGLIQDLS